MTRDEAIEKFSHTRFHMMGERRSETWIEMFVALGMLKLDEPKSVLRRAESALRVAIQVGSPDDPMDAMDVISCLDDAGLKIVEK